MLLSIYQNIASDHCTNKLNVKLKTNVYEHFYFAIDFFSLYNPIPFKNLNACLSSMFVICINVCYLFSMFVICIKLFVNFENIKQNRIIKLTKYAALMRLFERETKNNADKLDLCI